MKVVSPSGEVRLWWAVYGGVWQSPVQNADNVRRQYFYADRLLITILRFLGLYPENHIVGVASRVLFQL